MSQITITIDVDDEAENPLESTSAVINAPSELDADIVAGAILSTAESYIRVPIVAEYEGLFPGGNRGVIDALADQAARLAAYHELMHLPLGSHLSMQFEE